MRLRDGFGEYSKEWLLTKRSHGIKENTLSKYESNIRIHFLPFFGSKRLKAITLKDGEGFVRALLESHSPKGINIIVIVLKQILEEATKKGLIGKNPFKDLKLQPESERITNYWTQDEINIFLRANKDSHLFPVFSLAINTGMRRGELAGLKWDKVDFLGQQIIVSRTRDQKGLYEMTKTKVVKYIPMNETVLRTLQDLRMKCSGVGYVFVVDDKPINVHHIYRDFAKAQKAAGFEKKIRFHDLRHTFASNFMMNDGNIYDLQKILAHKDLKMTQRYAHLSQKHLSDSMAKMNFGKDVILETLSQIHPTKFHDAQEVHLLAVNS